VRQCHGDLHLRNLVLLDGHPTLFDGVEFNDEIACTDTLYDLAFLLMDLWRRHLPRHANAVWNRYLGETSDLDGAALMPLFLSCRAAVRAKTSVSAAQVQSASARRQEMETAARDYLSLAERLLDVRRPVLIAIGGLSGSGKSTLAVNLAPLAGAVPGAIVLRSDEIRKRLRGVPLLQRLGPDGYAKDVSDRVYATLRDRARQAIRAGHSAIVDAVFGRADERRLIEEVAAVASVPFIGVWLDAPESVLIARLGGRRDDPSDADAVVVRSQRAQDTGLVHWHGIDASASPSTVLATACDLLRKHPDGTRETVMSTARD
jgi:predicted kinase